MQKKSNSTVHTLFGSSRLYFIGDCFELILFLEIEGLCHSLVSDFHENPEEMAKIFDETIQKLLILAG